jgi:hypothetical protein
MKKLCARCGFVCWGLGALIGFYNLYMLALIAMVAGIALMAIAICLPEPGLFLVCGQCGAKSERSQMKIREIKPDSGGSYWALVCPRCGVPNLP